MTGLLFGLATRQETDSMVANLGWFCYESDVRQIGYRIRLSNLRKTTEFLISY